MTEQHRWRKSRYSGNQTNCVEIAVNSSTLVRDTKNRDAGHLTVSATAWSAFTTEVKRTH
jgi:hypothetical protein